MGISFEHETEVAASAQVVWSILAELRSWPSWTPTVLEVRPEGRDALELGNRFVLVQPKMPKLSWQVTQLEDGHGFTWAASAPGIRTVASHQVDALGEGCSRIRLLIEQSGLLAPLLSRAMGGRTRRYIELEAEGLAARAEGR